MTTIPKANIEHEIRRFVIDNFLFGREEGLTETAALLGGIIDSTGAIQLVMFLQEKFGITVEDDEIALPENFESIGNVVAFVDRKIQNGVSASTSK
jgi:acyl carrier protein